MCHRHKRCFHQCTPPAHLRNTTSDSVINRAWSVCRGLMSEPTHRLQRRCISSAPTDWQCSAQLVITLSRTTGAAWHLTRRYSLFLLLITADYSEHSIHHSSLYCLRLSWQIMVFYALFRSARRDIRKLL